MFTPPNLTSHGRLANIFDNSPVSSLIRDAPKGVDTDILILERNDLRDILFTAYSERGLPSRKLDITWCHEQEFIIAWNVLLLTLLLDGGIDSDTLWDLCFHLYVPKKAVDILKKQATKLRALSDSLATWNKSTYGPSLKWCEEGSLLLTSKIWETYGLISQSEDDAAGYGEFAKRFRDYHTTSGYTTGSCHIPEEARSAAPLSLPSIKDEAQDYKQSWEYITLSQVSLRPNPLYVTLLSMNPSLAHTVNPLFGFHLATAFSRLAPTSPLGLSQDDGNTPKVVRAAKTQFREWCTAFQEVAEDHIIIRFAVACPVTFCQTLQHNSVTQESSAGYFRRQFDASGYELDPGTYGADGTAPRLFDVIDASALTDRLEAINTLVSSSYLLKDAASSSLYMGISKEPNKTYKDVFDFLLFGHTPTLSLLLGLVPVDYWANSTSTSYVDELMLMSSLPSTHNETIRNYAKLSWKYSRYFPGQTHNMTSLHLDPVELATTIFRIYTGMPERYGRVYDARNFVAFIKQMLYTVNVDRAKTCETFLDLVCNDESSSLSRELYVELALELRLQGLYADNPICTEDGYNSSESVVVLLKVPRDEVDKIRGAITSNSDSSLLEAIISYQGGALDLLRARFTNLQLTFGDIQTTDNRESDNQSVTINQGPVAHCDNSPLIVSFYAPSSLVQKGLEASTISIITRHTQEDVKQPETTIFETAMRNQQNVFITSRLTNVHGYPITCARAIAIASVTRALDNNSPARTRWSVTLDPDLGCISNMTTTVNIAVEDEKAHLIDQHVILLSQNSPCYFDISFGENSVYPASFPIPALKDSVKIHVDSQSGSITLSAPPVTNPLDLQSFSELMYPMVVEHNSVSVPLNAGHINLDSLPILSVDEADKQANQWLTTLTSHQFSVHERRIREELMSSLDSNTPNPPSLTPPSPRLSFKESLFTIFMVSSGLQGGSTGLFALADQESGRGNQILLFVRTIRLDSASGSVVADAAALPLTRDLIDSRELETFLLVLRELEICVLDVDEAELTIWRRAIPAFAERCRDWIHDASTCEYRKPGAAILLAMSVDSGQPFMCTCGNGKVPRDFVRLPDWEGVASRHAVRIAISPTFASPFVEDIVDIELLRAQGGLEGLLKEKCRNCNATKSKKGGKLLWCMRCRTVRYCSHDCQKVDWKKHRMECKPAADSTG